MSKGKREPQAAKPSPHLYLIPRSEVERWKRIGKRKGGRPPKQQPDAAEFRRAEAEHQETLEEARRRIRGEPQGQAEHEGGVGSE